MRGGERVEICHEYETNLERNDTNAILNNNNNISTIFSNYSLNVDFMAFNGLCNYT